MLCRLSHWLLLVFIVFGLTASAQFDEGVLPIDDPVHRFLLRQQAAGHLDSALLTALPLSAFEAQALLDSLANTAPALSLVDRTLLARYRGEEPGPRVEWVQKHLGRFIYRDGESVISADGDGFALRVQPLAYLNASLLQRTDTPEADPTGFVWQNTRGVRVAGHAGAVFFETRLEENQRKPAFNEWEQFTAPRLNSVKPPDNGYYDYWLAMGIVGVRTRFFEVRFGRDRNHWGFGEGALGLSDYAAPYDQLQLRTRFWRIRYTNIFARRIRPVERVPGVQSIFPRGWSALHQLALDLPAGFQAELFEMTLFADDSVNARRNGFDLTYLNPAIFYRAVEADIGSPDNVLLGAGLSWNATAGYRFYGQLLLDELRVSEIGNDWWANKWGYLIGARLADPGFGPTRISNLDLSLEYTRQRPYLYSHRSASTAFVHSGDGLGHPAGPNSWDLAAFAQYRPLPTVEFALTAAYTRRGRNTESENFGSDPSLSYDSRVGNRDITTLQGTRQNEWLVEGRASFEVLPSLWFEGAFRFEELNDADTGVRRGMAVGGQLRWGLPYQSSRY